MEHAKSTHPPAAATAAAAPLTLRLFGAFALEIQGQKVTGVSRAAQELLTLLALRPNAPASRTTLAATLWPDAAHDRALFYLRRCLTEMRAALGAQQYRLASPTRTTLRFDFADAECDVIAFDRLANWKEEAALEQAIVCYGGPLLEACDAAWIVSERACRAELYTSALQILADRREEKGDLSGAARLWLRAVEADPLSEASVRRLMQTLARQGDYAALEKRFRQLRDHLHSELNIEPSAETVALHQSLRAQAHAAPVLPAPADAFAPTNRRLPCPLTSLIGRDHDRQEIGAALGGARLVTLTGPGGVGKTRLAIAAAEDTAENHPDGVVFVDLSSTRNSDDLPSALAATLGVSAGADALPEETLRRYLRRKNLLLIMDNAEHLLTPCARLVAFLLAECPALHLLCTSREPLRVSGERVIQIAPLDMPPSWETDNSSDAGMARLLSYPAAALLVERAGAASSAFRLSGRNAGAMAQICRRLDGIPLALELAAARFRSLSAQEIAARLEDRFRLLSSGDPALPRHQTLRAALDWSYSLLNAAEQRLLRQLSVFVGSWTLEAAQAVCCVEAEPEAVLSLLLSLVEKSLVVYAPQYGQDRYRLLETTREYAAECLSSEEWAIQEERHAVFFLRQVQEADGRAPEIQARDMPTQFWADHDNLRVARLWWQERNKEAAVWLEYSLYNSEGRRPGDWEARINRLQDAPLPISPLALLITFETGCWAMWAGHPAREELFMRVVDMASAMRHAEMRNAKWKSNALNMLFLLESERGNDTQALVYVEAALESARQHGNIYVISALEAGSAALLARLGDERQARHRLQVQLERGRQAQERAILLPTLNVLGELAFARRAWGEARSYWEELLRLAPQFNPIEVPNLWRNLACAAREAQDYEAAWHYLEQALETSRRNRSLDREGWTRWDMSETAFRQGDMARAWKQLERCLAAFRENEEPRVVAQCLRKAALYHKVEGRCDCAARLLGSVERRVQEQALALLRGEQQACDALAADLRETLGEEAWQAAFAYGKTLTSVQAETLAFACDASEAQTRPLRGV